MSAAFFKDIMLKVSQKSIRTKTTNALETESFAAEIFLFVSNISFPNLRDLRVKSSTAQGV